MIKRIKSDYYISKETLSVINNSIRLWYFIIVIGIVLFIFSSIINLDVKKMSEITILIQRFFLFGMVILLLIIGIPPLIFRKKGYFIQNEWDTKILLIMIFSLCCIIVFQLCLILFPNIIYYRISIYIFILIGLGFIARLIIQKNNKYIYKKFT
jgi:hypothetical protein